MEEAPPTPNAAATQPQAPPTATPSLPPSPAPDRDAGRRGGLGGGERLGLTKEVLSAHTQQEEHNFMYRFRDLSELRVFDPASALRQRATAPLARGEDMHKTQKQHALLHRFILHLLHISEMLDSDWSVVTL